MEKKRKKLPRIVLALSGGGFRATLFHLGVVSYLRQVNLLSRVEHICSVSGGSVLAGHLARNWTAYNSDQQDFDHVAMQVVDISACDVRNRIIRSVPIGAASSTRRLEKFWFRLLSGRAPWPWLLEVWRPLSEVESEPGAPLLSLLTTDLASGNLCALDADAVVVGQPGGASILRIPIGTIPLQRRIAASAAFPALFPPVSVSRAAPFDHVGDKEVQALWEMKHFRELELMKGALNVPKFAFADGGLLDNSVNSIAFLCRSGDYRLSAKQESVQIGEMLEPEDLFVVRSDAGAAFLPALGDQKHKYRLDFEGKQFGLMPAILRGYDVVMENHAQLQGKYAASIPHLNIVLADQRKSLRWGTYEIDRCVWQTTHIRTDFDRFNRAEIRWLLTVGQIAAHDSLNGPGSGADICRRLGRGLSWPTSGLVGRQDGLWLPEVISKAEAQPSDFEMLRSSHKRNMWGWLRPW